MERQLLSKGHVLIFVGFLFLAHSCALANDPKAQSLANAIASTLGYPPERLIITDKTVEYAKKTGGNALLVYSIESKDGTFAPMGVSIAKRGALVKPEFEARWEAVSKKNTPNVNRSVRKVGLSEGAYAYTGLSLGGPGGSEEIFLAVWPSRGIDMQIKITLSRDSPIRFDAATATYHNLVMEGEVALADKMLKAMGHLMTHAKERNLTAANNVEAVKGLPNPGDARRVGPANPREQPKRDLFGNDASQPNAAAPVAAVGKADESAPVPGGWALWAGIAAALVVIAALALKKRAS